jgi:hypothetical protein
LRNQFKKWSSGDRKTNTLSRLLGYTRAEFRAHIEAQFTDGMGWHNKGKWHVDHRIPKNMFDPRDPEQLRRCWALSNLRPLWGSDNCSRPHDGSDLPRSLTAGLATARARRSKVLPSDQVRVRPAAQRATL